MANWKTQTPTPGLVERGAVKMSGSCLERRKQVLLSAPDSKIEWARPAR